MFNPWTCDTHTSDLGCMSTENEPQSLSKAFGDAVRALRGKTGLSQEKFAFHCGLDRTYVSLIERGIRNPTIKTVWIIANALGVKPSQLIDSAERVLAGEKPSKLIPKIESTPSPKQP